MWQQRRYDSRALLCWPSRFGSLAGGVAWWMMCSVAPLWTTWKPGGAAPAIHIVSRGCGLGEDVEWFWRRLGLVDAFSQSRPGRVMAASGIAPAHPSYPAVVDSSTRPEEERQGLN